MPDDGITLKEYIEHHWKRQDAEWASAWAQLELRLQEHQLAHAREHGMTQDAIGKAEVAMEKRFDAVTNSWQTLADQASTFARIETVDSRIQSEQERREAEDRNLDSRREALEKELKTRLAAAEAQLQTLAGRSGGSAQTIQYIVTAITVAAALLAIGARFLP